MRKQRAGSRGSSGGRAVAKKATARQKEPRSDTSTARRSRIVSAIRALPRGKVSTYGGIARAANWAGAARQVVRILRQVSGLPWHRVVGSGGAIKLPGENGAEQRFRLRMEGVTFRGARVDMKKHEFRFASARDRKKKKRTKG